MASKCVYGWGSAPNPAGGAYSAPPDPLAGLRRSPTSKRRGRDREREGEGKGEGRGREGGRGNASPLQALGEWNWQTDGQTDGHRAVT